MPQAALVHGKFHVAKHLNEAVDAVRRAEHKALLAQRDETITGSRQLWLSYLRYPITNAATEGLNSKIQAIKANARGFRSFQNFRILILLFCGKLALHP